jgi:hypothetical protein
LTKVLSYYILDALMSCGVMSGDLIEATSKIISKTS